MSETEVPTSRIPLRSLTIVLSLIAIAHLPFFLVECRALWNRDHYQFFPFAFLAFGWLFYDRCLPGVVKWDYLNSALLLADFALLAGAVVLPQPSPLLVCMGLMCFLLAFCRASSDRHYNCSLAYLFLLPLMTLRPPWNYDVDAIQWLQKSTTSVASRLLNYFGFLHLRQGNVLEFPGKRFLVEEACSGVQSLFTILFLAALIICGHRRRWLHAIVVLVSAACLAGVMNVLRIFVVATAWSALDVDWSSGWQHDLLGYAVLVIAGALVLSADALFEFLSSPVPDEPGVGVQSIFFNPFAAMWNWLFRRSRRVSSGATVQGQATCGLVTVFVTAGLSLCFVIIQLMKF